MPGTSYEDVVKSAEALGPADRLRLAAELIRQLGGQPDQAAPRSVLELRGLGKDVWLGASVEEYLARERSASPPFRPTGMNSGSGCGVSSRQEAPAR